MKKYFKIGIGTIIPTALVLWVLNMLYGFIDKIVVAVLPSSVEYQVWFVLPLIVILFILIELVGFFFSHIRLVKWINKQFEKLIKKVPIIGVIYEFGLEIVDSFITDNKLNGEKFVVEIKYGGQKKIGLLSDEIMKIVFVPTAPNPMNGEVIKVDEYKIIAKMKVKDFFKLIGSLGSIGAEKWK